METPRVLIVGLSARAAAESAARAGFQVTALDAFNDLDQHPSVRSLSIGRDPGARFSARAAARVAQDIECDAVTYLANFENQPAAIETLARGRSLWGNPPDVVRRVRDPVLLAETLRRRGCAAPAVNVPHDSNEWLVKPVKSGGGRGVRMWRGVVPRGCYVQELIEGTAGSVVFVAAGGRAVPLGISRQIVGDGAFGASGYQYCGNILAGAGHAHFAPDEALVDAACDLAAVVAREFDLVGLNGIDFIARDGVPYAIEVNPRWCSSMELVERAYNLSVFDAHASACVSGELRALDLRAAMRRGPILGKAIVFARREAHVGETAAWLADANVRDVPHPGDRIPTGAPVCTVFAAGPTDEACYADLVREAAEIYTQLMI